jgi:urease accessory protein
MHRIVMAMPMTMCTMQQVRRIDMTDGSLIRLMSWLSPVFPTGGFAYSAGLEKAVQSGLVRNSAGLGEWLEAQYRYGSIRNDAILLASAHRSGGDGSTLLELSGLAEALADGAARHRETMNLGRSFLEAAAHWPGLQDIPKGLALPVAIGAAASRSGIDLEDCLQAFLNGFAVNQLQAAIRLSVTGQNGAAKTLAGLEPLILRTANDCARTDIDGLGSCTFNAAIAAMNHEMLEPRLFLS